MITVSRKGTRLVGQVNLPSSKSISNRMLLLRHYYHNSFEITNLSDADDTVLLSTILELIRQYKEKNENRLLRIDTRNAGSVIRFLIPLLSLTRGHFLLTGSDRMKHRPVGALVEAMREAGADIDYLENTGFPPLLIRGRQMEISRLRLDASVSSQFVTALMLVAPTFEEGLTLELMNSRVSWPYVNMTIGVLENLGIKVIAQEGTIRVFPQKELKSRNTIVETDWSSASFWYCMLALAGKGELQLNGLKRSGLQGDQEVAIIFSKLGIVTRETNYGIAISAERKASDGFTLDFDSHPDLALPAVMACCICTAHVGFTGLERLRDKESDRLQAITSNLSGLGIRLEEISPGLWHTSGKLISPCVIQPEVYNDHRVAMTMACLAAGGFTVQLERPEVVNKSYPGFWKDLENTGFSCCKSC